MGFAVKSSPPPALPGQLWLSSTPLVGFERTQVTFNVHRGGGGAGACAVDWSIHLPLGQTTPQEGVVVFQDGEEGSKPVTVTLPEVAADVEGAILLSNARTVPIGGRAPIIATASRSLTVRNDTVAPTQPSLEVPQVLSSSSMRIALATPATDAETGLQHYTLQRATNASFTQNVNSNVAQGLDIFPYTATGLSAGTTYYWRVVATDRAGNSVTSAVVHATTQGASPGYTPIFLWSAAGGSLGTNISGWQSSTRLTYSNDVQGPFGGNRVARQSLLASSNFFGGIMVGGLSLGSGQDLWIRVYHYFPAGFCFSCGTVSGDRWGNVKWYRLQFSSGRLTAQMGGLAGTAFANAPGSCGSQAGWGGVTDEYGGGGHNIVIDSPGAQVQRGQWLAIQTHVRLASDNTGYVESWINDIYVGRGTKNGASSYRTMPTTGTLSYVMLGDYWNGGPGFDQSFYLDEVIISTQTPTTVDAGGRPFIAPTTRVEDF